MDLDLHLAKIDGAVVGHRVLILDMTIGGLAEWWSSSYLDSDVEGESIIAKIVESITDKYLDEADEGTEIVVSAVKTGEVIQVRVFDNYDADYLDTTILFTLGSNVVSAWDSSVYEDGPMTSATIEGLENETLESIVSGMYDICEKYLGGY